MALPVSEFPPGLPPAKPRLPENPGLPDLLPMAVPALRCRGLVRGASSSHSIRRHQNWKAGRSWTRLHQHATNDIENLTISDLCMTSWQEQAGLGRGCISMPQMH